MSEKRPTLTAAELIEALGRIHPNTVITWYGSDYDYDAWYKYGVSGVDADGGLGSGGIVAAGSLSDHFNEEDADE